MVEIHLGSTLPAGRLKDPSLPLVVLLCSPPQKLNRLRLVFFAKLDSLRLVFVFPPKGQRLRLVFVSVA